MNQLIWNLYERVISKILKGVEFGDLSSLLILHIHYSPCKHSNLRILQEIEIVDLCLSFPTRYESGQSDVGWGSYDQIGATAVSCTAMHPWSTTVHLLGWKFHGKYESCTAMHPLCMAMQLLNCPSMTILWVLLRFMS